MVNDEQQRMKSHATGGTTVYKSAGRDYYEVYDHSTLNITTNSPVDDALKVFSSMKGTLDEMELTPKDKKKALYLIDGVVLEAEEDHVNKEAVAEGLKKVTSFVKEKSPKDIEGSKWVEYLKKGLKWAGKTLIWALA